MGNAALGMMYALIVLICVGVSVYTTYDGFLSFFGPLSPAIAIVIGLALLSVDVAIRDRARLKKRWAPIVFLIVCMVASSPSHFNYFYTEAVGQTLITDKAEQALQIRDRNLESARARLAELDTATRAVTDIQQQLQLLQEQIDDTGRSGYGERADGHVTAIVTAAREAGQPFTDFLRPAIGTPREEALIWLVDFRRRVLARIDAIRDGSPLKETTDWLLEEDARLLVLRAEFEQSTNRDARIRAGIDLIEEIKVHLVSLETKVNSVSQARDPDRRNWTLVERPLEPVEAEVGTVALSYRSGIVEMEYPHITLFAIIASIVIDILPLMFVLLVSQQGVAPPADTEGGGWRKWFGRKSREGYELLGEGGRRG